MQDVYFNPNYSQVYKDIDGDSKTFTFECPFGKVTNTFIMRKIPWTLDGNVYYDIVTPYGYGGPYAENVNDITLLMAEYKKTFTEFCKTNHIICEFIRFHLFDNVDVRENYYGNTLNLLDNVVVNTTGDYESKIWMSYEHKVRKNVKKALKNSLEIIIEQNTEHLEDFLKIYNSTMDRNNTTSYYYFGEKYFKDIEKLIPENFVYFHVVKEGVICSTELVLYSEKYAYSFLGGTLIDYYEFRPNDFLKNEIIKWCNKTGRKFFVLGGGYHKDDGIYKYKRCFTPEPDVPFYVGRYIFDEDMYNKAVRARKVADNSFDEETSYFPKYRG